MKQWQGLKTNNTMNNFYISLAKNMTIYINIKQKSQTIDI